MPKSKWIMGLFACLMLAGAVLYWLKTEEVPAPALWKASETTEAFFAALPERGGAGVSAVSTEETAETWIFATEALLVNINTAGAEELQRLPGIGPVKAEAILTYRKQHGLFQTTEDLMKVPGIKAATYAKLEPYVTV